MDNAALFVLGFIVTFTAIMLASASYSSYLKPNLDLEADMFVNTAIDLGMVEYDEFNAYIEGWGEVWIANHPYASGGVYRRVKGMSGMSMRGKRLRLRTVRRLLKDRAARRVSK